MIRFYSASFVNFSVSLMRFVGWEIMEEPCVVWFVMFQIVDLLFR